MEMQRREDGRYHGKTRAYVMPDRAFVILELERATGRLLIDQEFSTPNETFAMLMRAAQIVEERLQAFRED